MKMMILIDYSLTPLFFYVYLQVYESQIYPLILEMLKRRGLKFGDAVIMDRGFYGYKNYDWDKIRCRSLDNSRGEIQV